MKRNKNVVLALIVILTTVLIPLSGCSDNGIKLDPQKPVTITVWHYYNGAIMTAFETMVSDFNETVGQERGIIVESNSIGTVAELEAAVLAAARKDTGSRDMPNIFASYADTAYEAEQLGLLANLGDYLTAQEQAEYVDSYIEEGKIGLNGELRIFPVAKSTEIMSLNDTDWLPFANEKGFSYDDLNTMEGVARVAAAYYEWSDAKTPNVANDGKALWGRDSMANFFIIAVKEFGQEIFKVENGVATVNVDKTIMRKLWDNYYVPYISGHFFAYGKYRSDDAKVGDILAYVGSTSSSAYFPSEVTVGGNTYPVAMKILPAPHFEGASRVMVQQGAGMVVTKGTPQQEYASVLFLKWFTDVPKNIEFASLSSYMPVKKEAVDYDKIIAQMTADGVTLDAKTDATLKIAIEEVKTSELYTNKAFAGGVKARSVLDAALQTKAVEDREKVLALIADGASLKDAVAQLNTDEAFNAWLEKFTRELQDAAG